MSYQCVDHSLGILAGYFHQHHESALTFDKSRNLAGSVAEQQVTFPMLGYCAILRCGGAFTDRYSVANVRAVFGFQRVMARPAHGSRASQVFNQFLFQGVSRLA